MLFPCSRAFSVEGGEGSYIISLNQHSDLVKGHVLYERTCYGGGEVGKLGGQS